MSWFYNFLLLNLPPSLFLTILLFNLSGYFLTIKTYWAFLIALNIDSNQWFAVYRKSITAYYCLILPRHNHGRSRHDEFKRRSSIGILSEYSYSAMSDLKPNSSLLQSSSANYTMAITQIKSYNYILNHVYKCLASKLVLFGLVSAFYLALSWVWATVAYFVATGQLYATEHSRFKKICLTVIHMHHLW